MDKYIIGINKEHVLINLRNFRKLQTECSSENFVYFFSKRLSYVDHFLKSRKKKMRSKEHPRVTYVLSQL